MVIVHAHCIVVPFNHLLMIELSIVAINNSFPLLLLLTPSQQRLHRPRPQSLHHVIEVAKFVVQEIHWRVILHHPALIQHHYTVVEGRTVQAMADLDHCRVFELLLDDSGDEEF